MMRVNLACRLAYLLNWCIFRVISCSGREILKKIAVYAAEARCACGLVCVWGICHSFSLFCSGDTLVCSLSLSCLCVWGVCCLAVVLLVGDLSLALLLVLSSLFSFLLSLFCSFCSFAHLLLRDLSRCLRRRLGLERSKC
jgi:hypothetical protein